jgi:hypothetical protein
LERKEKQSNEKLMKKPNKGIKDAITNVLIPKKLFWP